MMPPRSVTADKTGVSRKRKDVLSQREVCMKLKSLGVVIALSVALPFAVADAAFAAKKAPAKKLTFEEAWAKCQVEVDKLQRDAQSQRYSRGAACMHTYGYRI